ncbi:hypothetical protein C1H46_008250 [Malus baccata]|uniref:DUF241 domain-containing protein n=1 Tax=Malus baccata TaxID=106549 RepID=A0A540N559_MALBA|nr:hypothetical protein C1H46_008250 [Malus baccata]
MDAKYEVRSISLPSRSHPTTIRVEEELSKRQTSSASASICKVLCGLEELYDCVDDLLPMASTQQLISRNQQGKCMDELLDGSLRLLDLCGITRDAMSQIKEHVRDLQSTLRRRNGDSNIESSIANYNCFRKKMKKDAKKLITSLKQVNNKAPQLMVHDQRAPAVVRVLREVFAKNMSIFQSLLVFFAVPVSKPMLNKWCLISKLMHKGVIACEDQKEDIHGHELDGVDAALYSLCKSSSAPAEGANVEKIQNAHKKLETLEVTVEGLEKGLESIFRRLIKTRASLLNIISQ